MLTTDPFGFPCWWAFCSTTVIFSSLQQHSIIISFWMFLRRLDMTSTRAFAESTPISALVSLSSRTTHYVLFRICLLSDQTSSKIHHLCRIFSRPLPEAVPVLCSLPSATFFALFSQLYFLCSAPNTFRQHRNWILLWSQKAEPGAALWLIGSLYFIFLRRAVSKVDTISGVNLRRKRCALNCFDLVFNFIKSNKVLSS